MRPHVIKVTVNGAREHLSQHAVHVVVEEAGQRLMEPDLGKRLVEFGEDSLQLAGSSSRAVQLCRQSSMFFDHRPPSVCTSSTLSHSLLRLTVIITIN